MESWINGKVSINEAEAMAMFEAMKQLQQRGYTNVVLKQIPKLLKILSAICILVCQSSVLLLVKLDICCHYVTPLK
jgi:lipid A disaccharide synthetase